MTIPYTSLWGSTVARKEDIKNNWYFECRCERCSAEDDWGSGLDTVRCGAGACGGWLAPDRDNSWACDICQKTLHWENIVTMETHIKGELEVGFSIISQYAIIAVLITSRTLQQLNLTR